MLQIEGLMIIALDIYDAENNSVYQWSYGYDSGINTDYWDGQSNDGSKLDKGKYMVRQHKDQSRFMYLNTFSASRIWA